MTLADYSLSDVTFDRVEKWKNTLNQLIISSNQTEALEAMIPQLEEFIYVARSELVCSPISFMCMLDIRQEMFPPNLCCFLNSENCHPVFMTIKLILSSFVF